MDDHKETVTVKGFTFSYGIIVIGWVVIPADEELEWPLYFDNRVYDNVKWSSCIKYATFGLSSKRVLKRMIKWLTKHGYIKEDNQEVSE